MEMNHEYYVSSEVAELLKKAGFDWECTHYYSVNMLHEPNNGFIHIYRQYKALFYDHNRTKMPVYSAPTLEVAQRWLREVKNIDVVVLRAMQWIQFYYTVEHEENRTSKVDFMSLNEDLWWFKYEEAQEAGIKKALELILEKGK